MPRPMPIRAEDPQSAADRQTSSLAGLAMALALVVVCLFLIRQLHASAALEDCMLSGRTNCGQIISARH